MKQSKKHARRSEAQIRELLSLQKKQDIPVTNFCKANNINKATFYFWRKRYADVAAVNQQTFLPLQITAQEWDNTSIFCEIELPSNSLIRFFHQVDPSYLKSLLQ